MRRLAFFLGCALALLASATSARAADLAVGSKNFEESRLLCELFARLIEARTDLTVERRFNFASGKMCVDAMEKGELDLYPEYTGTALFTILGRERSGDARDVLYDVRRALATEHDLRWLAPLGFENTYALAVPRRIAEQHQLSTITDLARVSKDLRGGFGFEFVKRPDGLPALKATYGLDFKDVQRMQQNLKLSAVASNDIECLDVYSTDGTIARYDLVVLADDRGVFPPYEAGAIVRGATLREHPELHAVLELLAGALDAPRMQRWNRRLQEDKEPVERVAQDALEELGLAEVREVKAVSTKGQSLLGYMWTQREALGAETLWHLALAGAGLLLAILVAVPLGLWLERWRRGAEPTIRAIAVTQTIPSIALLAFMIPLLGTGAPPAIAALWIYALYPIARNTYTGVREADPAAVAAATALGMTPAQVLRQVRLPLAVPTIMAGVRTAAVLLIGTATLGAFVGARGLGRPIVTGLQTNDVTMILSGALLAAVLAVLVDLVLGLVERRLTPEGR